MTGALNAAGENLSKRKKICLQPTGLRGAGQSLPARAERGPARRPRDTAEVLATADKTPAIRGIGLRPETKQSRAETEETAAEKSFRKPCYQRQHMDIWVFPRGFSAACRSGFLRLAQQAFAAGSTPAFAAHKTGRPGFGQQLRQVRRNDVLLPFADGILGKPVGVGTVVGMGWGTQERISLDAMGFG
ncbi:hypothetical protein [Roseimaritima sediminicola]|uniref:hypothetical protein n=1 Tax=Roseimaritima sediminicola TaxID=2662066 RepID=UPI00129823F2|nr:hypothetical protein [Roseimaritima sediminicola]